MTIVEVLQLLDQGQYQPQRGDNMCSLCRMLKHEVQSTDNIVLAVCRNPCIPGVPAYPPRLRFNASVTHRFYITGALHLVFPYPDSYKYFAALRLALPSVELV